MNECSMHGYYIYRSVMGQYTGDTIVMMYGETTITNNTATNSGGGGIFLQQYIILSTRL